LTEIPLGEPLPFSWLAIKLKSSPSSGKLSPWLIIREGENVETNELVVFAKNEEGWKNLLLINKHINIDNDGYIWEKDLKECSSGLICVLSKESIVNKLSDLKTAKGIHLQVPEMVLMAFTTNLIP
jgi:DNA polymerase III alpha subunit